MFTQCTCHILLYILSQRLQGFCHHAHISMACAVHSGSRCQCQLTAVTPFIAESAVLGPDPLNVGTHLFSEADLKKKKKTTRSTRYFFSQKRRKYYKIFELKFLAESWPLLFACCTYAYNMWINIHMSCNRSWTLVSNGRAGELPPRLRPHCLRV